MSSQKTPIRFFGVLPGAYPGASRKGCNPTDPAAVGWHVVVGGTQCAINSVEDFAKHFADFLYYAYQAGVEDTKAELRKTLGL